MYNANDVQEKRILKEEKLRQEEKYMWAVLDGVRERVISFLLLIEIYSSFSKFANHNFQQFQIGNFRVEPPGLFRGRGEHPKVYFCCIFLHYP